jgi:hypothetical protein
MFTADEPIRIRLTIKKQTPVRGVFLHFLIKNNEEIALLETDSREGGYPEIDTDTEGEFTSVINIPQRLLKSGRFHVCLGIASTQHDPFQIESLDSFMSFDVLADKTPRDSRRNSVLSTILEWKTA